MGQVYVTEVSDPKANSVIGKAVYHLIDQMAVGQCNITTMTHDIYRDWHQVTQYQLHGAFNNIFTNPLASSV